MFLFTHKNHMFYRMFWNLTRMRANIWHLNERNRANKVVNCNMQIFIVCFAKLMIMSTLLDHYAFLLLVNNPWSYVDCSHPVTIAGIRGNIRQSILSSSLTCLISVASQSRQSPCQDEVSASARWPQPPSCRPRPRWSPVRPRPIRRPFRCPRPLPPAPACLPSHPPVPDSTRQDMFIFRDTLFFAHCVFFTPQARAAWPARCLTPWPWTRPSPRWWRRSGRRGWPRGSGARTPSRCSPRQMQPSTSCPLPESRSGTSLTESKILNLVLFYFCFMNIMVYKCDLCL